MAKKIVSIAILSFFALTAGVTHGRSVVTFPSEQVQQAEALLQQSGYRHARVVEAMHPRLGHRAAIVIIQPKVNGREARKAEALNVFQQTIELVDSRQLTLVTIREGKRLDLHKIRRHDHLFWKAADGGWRRITIDLAKYLHTKLASADESTSPFEIAYLHWSLALVGAEGRHPEQAAALMEIAYRAAQDANDDGRHLCIWVLQDLVRIYARAGDQENLKRTLRRFAAELGEEAIPIAEYQPMLKKKPAYPLRALKNGVSGTATVQFTVTADGTVEDVEVISEQPSGHGFGNAAKRAAAKFFYVPRIVDGELVATQGVRNKMTFAIE